MVDAYFCVLIAFVSRLRKDLIWLIIVVHIKIKKYEENVHQDVDKNRHVSRRICERKTTKRPLFACSDYIVLKWKKTISYRVNMTERIYV